MTLRCLLNPWRFTLANRPVPQMTYTGECHYCEEPIDKGHFCSDECRTDHERIQHALRNQKVA